MAPRGITAQGILNGFFTTGRRGNSLGLGSTKLNINSGNRSAGSDAVALNLSKQEDNSTGPIASQAALSGDIRKNSLKAIRDLADQAANLSKRLATLQGGSQSDEIENELAAIANEIRNLTGYGEDINGLYAARDDASQDADNADAAVIVNQNGITSLQL
ncbi:MAG: hypothetical protein J5J00_02830, partial [Deltaproteobacteria bacterium]|nr:hypothetical protein [Deltaproteobacteria bacterium]